MLHPAHIFHVQDSYQQPIARMLDFFITAYQENPATTLEVFVHKAESLAEDYKIGMWSRDTTLFLPGVSPYAIASVLHLRCALSPWLLVCLLTRACKALSPTQA
jgi:hypothetical protein